MWKLVLDLRGHKFIFDISHPVRYKRTNKWFKSSSTIYTVDRLNLPTVTSAMSDYSLGLTVT